MATLEVGEEVVSLDEVGFDEGVELIVKLGVVVSTTVLVCCSDTCDVI